MTGPKSKGKRPYQFHGTYGLSKALSSVKDQDQWLTDQGPVGDALKQLRAELIEQQGGAERVSPGELMTIEGLVFAHMLMMSAGRFIGEQASPVNKSRRQLFPVVTQWLTLFREVRETAKDLNELRTKRPKPEPLLLADYLNGNGKATPQPGSTHDATVTTDSPGPPETNDTQGEIHAPSQPEPQAPPTKEDTP